MARKLNTKFIAVLGVAGLLVGGGGVIAVVYGKDLFRPSIAKLEQEGDEAFAAGDYKLASELYGRAAYRARTDVPLQLKFVNAFDFTVDGDMDKMRELRQHYSTVLSAAPRNEEIIRLVLRAQLQDARSAPQYRPALRSLAETAERLLEVVPNDREARKAAITVVLEPYQRNLEVSAEDVSNAREAAEKLYEEAPNDGEVALMVVRFRLEEAKDAAARGAIAEAKAALDAVQKFVDEAMVKSPDNAEVFFAGFNVYRALGTLGGSLPQEKRKELIEKANKLLEQADGLARASDFENDEERFLNIRAFAIRMVELRDGKAAEARYRQLIQEMPNNRWPRLLLSQYLTKLPARRTEAAEVLEAKWSPTKPLRAMESLQQRGLEIQEQLRLAVIQLNSLEFAASPEEREKTLKKVEENYGRLASLPNPQGTLVPWLRRIQGSIALERGRVSEAIEQLDAAQKLLPADALGQAESEVRNEVLLEYANAHLRIGQTGKARPALQELVSRDPINMNARVLLTRVLLAERRFDEAEKQVEDLARFLPDNPIVEQLRVQVYGQRKDILRERYAKLTETTPQQIQIKLQAAAMLDDVAEQERLARALLAAVPENSDVAMLLAQVLLRQDKRDEALVVIDAALKGKPDHERLKNFRDQLVAVTPEDRRKLLQDNIEKITDPYQKELVQAQVLRLQGKLDDALSALKKAEEIDPKNVRAIVEQFDIVAAQRKFTEAEALIEKLVGLKADTADIDTKRVVLLVARAQDKSDPAERQQLLSEALLQASQNAARYSELAQPSLLYAKLLQDAGNVVESLEQYQQVLDKQPANVEAQRGAITCMIALKRYGEARSRLEAARRQAPNDESLRQLELSLELEHGDPLRVIDTLTQVRDQNVESPQAWVQLGYAIERVAADKSRKNDDAGARAFLTRAGELWRQAMEKFPSDLRFASAYAETQRRIGRPDEAEAAIVKLTQQAAFADKPEVFELLALQYQRAGKLADAERLLSDFLNRVKPMPTSTLLKLAMLYIDQQRLQEALAVLDMKQDDPDVRRTRIELLIMANDLSNARRAIEESLANNATPDIFLLAAFVELRAGEWDKADGFVAKVLQSRPNDPAALFYRSQVRVNSAKPNIDGAIEDLQKVLAINVGNIEARTSLADLYIRRNQRDLAIRQLEQAWAYNPGAKLVLLRLVDAYLASTPSRPTAAQKVIDEATQDPASALAKDPDVTLAAANVAMATNQNRKAIELAKTALAVAPDNGSLLQRYYDVLLRAQAYRDLLKESEATLQKDRGAWWLYRLRGQAYRRLEQKTEAAKEFDAAFNLVTAAQNEPAIAMVARTVAQELGVQESIKRIEPIARTDLSSKLLLASMYQTANDPTRALEQLERVKADSDRLRPDQRRTLLQTLGTVYLQITPPAPEKARQVYEELLNDSPNDMLLLNNLAYVNTLPESGGSIAKALEYSSKAYDMSQSLSSLDESVLYIWDTHGWVLVKNNKILDGLNILQKASERAAFPEVFLHLAEAYMLNNELGRAESALQEAESIITSYTTKNMPLDPTVRPKFERLSADLQAKIKSSVGVAQ